MRAYNRLGVVCLSLFLLLSLMAQQVTLAQAESACASLALPANAAPFLPRSAALLNLLTQVDSEREMQTIAALQNMVTRHVMSPKNSPTQGIGAAARYITSQFQQADPLSLHMIVSSQEFYTKWQGETLQLENIIATIPGSQPDLGAMVIGAHYDSRSSDLNDQWASAPGADDNASGVAALLELARLLSTAQPRMTIMLVAFSGEEIGRVGSIHFVRDYLPTQPTTVRYMINMDIIGGAGQDGLNIDSDRIRLFSPGPDNSDARSLARTIQLIAYQYLPEMPVDVQDTADRAGRYGDQQSFNEKGYPAVRFVEEIEAVGREHNPLDTMDHIQPRYLYHATQVILAAVKVLADGPRPPATPTLTDNGNGSPELAWTLVSDAASYVVALRSPGSMVYDQQFEVIGTSVDWSGFDASCYEGVAISAKDADDLMGPLSQEYPLT